MNSIRMLIALLLLSFTAITSAHTAGNIRAGDEGLQFVDGKTLHTVAIPRQHMWAAMHVESIIPIHTARIGDERYFLLQIDGPSKYPPALRGKCGSGWEVDLLWLHLNAKWELIDVQRSSLDSCWSSITDYDFGSDIQDESKYRFSKEHDILISRTAGSREEVKLLYSFREPTEGLRVTTSSIERDGEEQVGYKTFPGDMITTAQKTLFGASYPASEHRLFVKREGFEQLYADFLEATWSDNHTASWHSLNKEFEDFSNALTARLADPPTDHLESKKQWELDDKELNEAYAALTAKLEGLQELWLRVSQRRWIKMRDEYSQFVARIRKHQKSFEDDWTRSFLTRQQTQRLKQALARPLPAQLKTGNEYWQ